MVSVKLGGLDVVLTGGSDRNGGGDGPVVVLMHGFGAPGDDLVSLARVIEAPKDTRFAFPVAPLDLGPMYAGGRAWFWVDIGARQLALAQGRRAEIEARVPEGMESASHLVGSMLDALCAHLSVAPERIVLGGFSQGAMMATDVALRTQRPLAGLALLSGTLIAKDVWAQGLAARKGLPVFQSHGSHDPILDAEGAQHLHAMLEGAGLATTWVPFRGGHEIPGVAVQELGVFLRRVAK
jgi:phospholipase/carboxylesterase